MKALVLALLIPLCSRAGDFWLTSTNSPSQPQFTACEGFMALVVLTVGGVVIYKICKANFWTNIPAPPEPPPAPPATNNAATNNPSTNGHRWFHWAFGGGRTTKSPPDSTPQYYQSNSWISPDGLVFDIYAHGDFPQLQSSRDLSTWSNCQYDSWANTNGCLYVIYDGYGLPLYTNYTTEETNILDGCWATEPEMFFRFNQ